MAEYMDMLKLTDWPKIYEPRIIGSNKKRDDLNLLLELKNVVSPCTIFFKTTISTCPIAPGRVLRILQITQDLKRNLHCI